MTDLLHAAALSLLGALALILVEGIRRRDVSVTINALVALGAVLLPKAVEAVLARGVGFGPELVTWIAAAGLLHSVGMLGIYESIWWWDHLTHTVSAALVAALAYAALLARPDLGVVAGSIAGTTVLFVLAVGTFWELIELIARDVGERYGVAPVLVHYGWRDTAFDLLFDVVGALAVVALDVRVFGPIAGRHPAAAGSLLLGAGGVAVAGSVLMALLVFGIRES